MARWVIHASCCSLAQWAAFAAWVACLHSEKLYYAAAPVAGGTASGCCWPEAERSVHEAGTVAETSASKEGAGRTGGGGGGAGAAAGAVVGAGAGAGAGVGAGAGAGAEADAAVGAVAEVAEAEADVEGAVEDAMAPAGWAVRVWAGTAVLGPAGTAV